MNVRINIPNNKIAEFCQRHHIKRLALFGSVLRDDFTPESDVDILVDFEPDTHIGYIGLAGLEIELIDMLGRNVDLHTLEGVERSRNGLLQKEILGTAETVYEQT
ncbi:MAG: nucleotidyltransferase family protein [Gemmatimonadetes bacterium]|nr:nucleotidyltransferase family protein [Gemmatimonadota bacterium]MYH18015.1 nucleotidyltransferase family protein [Gemmatimonadota bacterium]MYK98342.1 nucleotidyltransferase family protein [Gemmatimonadota bacterium]